MFRRLLVLTLAGLGASAAAVLLSAGTADALPPVPAQIPPVAVPPVAVPVPEPAPLPIVTKPVARTVERVSDSVRFATPDATPIATDAPSPHPAAAPAPVARTQSPHAATASNRALIARLKSRRSASLATPDGVTLRAARPSGPALRLLLAELADNTASAVAPTRSGNGTPFALNRVPIAMVNPWSRRVATLVAAAPRRGVVVGMTRPG